METINSILHRRSVRKYKDRKVPEEIINNLLKAGMYAPSAFNLQPWEFIVVDDKAIIEDIIKAVPYAELLRQASHTIIVCGDNNIEKTAEFLIQDCSAAIQNILLAAHDACLGACWIASSGINDTVSSLQKIFKLPDSILPVAIISLGYPDESPAAEERFNKEKIHINKW